MHSKQEAREKHKVKADVADEKTKRLWRSKSTLPQEQRNPITFAN